MTKFETEVNQEQKEFEENAKFSKLRGSDITIGDDTVGSLLRANFPFLEIRVNPDWEQNQLLRLLDSCSSIKPDVKGELEKIHRMEQTIQALEDKDSKLANPGLREFIFDASKAKQISDPDCITKNSDLWNEVLLHKNANLNDSQIKGVASSLTAEDLAIIQGPPGTGKSTAISEIIWHHIRKRQEQVILLTSETHLAVDNALGKLDSLKSNLVKPIRFGVQKEDIESLSEEDATIEAKVESEGLRYSLQRFENWAQYNSDHPYYGILKDNAIQHWMHNISAKSKEASDGQTQEVIEKWKSYLDSPTLDFKNLFKEKYIKYRNVVGATSSSIAERNRPIVKDGKEFTPKTSFYRDYQKTFGFRSEMNFDVVITDEASKATPPELAMPLLYGKKNIIVGDHRQLPPMLDEEDFVTTLETINEKELARIFQSGDINQSHFERLFLRLPQGSPLKTTFDEQYRMHSSINEVISQFYSEDGGLKCGLDPLKENSPDLSEPQSRWHGINIPEFVNKNTHVVWVNVDHPEVKEGTSRVNYGELEACKLVIQKLTASSGFSEFQNYWQKEEDKEIGLITFYGKQLSLIRRMISSEFSDVPIRAKTVDRFQGMERNIVIVSLVRSNKIAATKDQPPDFDAYPESGGYQKQKDLGFAKLPNRLNVALSRAKRLLIIVGNIDHFSQNEIYANVYDTVGQSVHGEIIYDYTHLGLPEFE